MKTGFLRRAIALAAEKSRGGVCGPFGAVVAKDGVIVGEGWNRVVESCDPSAHAEVVAIRQAAERLGTHVLTGCEIYCSCEPCPMCLAAICWARIGSVIYACGAQDAAWAGFDDVAIRDEIVADPACRTLAMTQMCREEGLAVLRAWRVNPNRQEY
jgi:tRNA(Arg) A34 adenosine deaminase TadA